MATKKSNSAYTDGKDVGFAISGCQVDGGSSGNKWGRGRGSMRGNRTKAVMRREEVKATSSTKNSFRKAVLWLYQVKKLVFLRRNKRSQSFYENNLFKSGVYKPRIMCTAFFMILISGLQ